MAEQHQRSFQKQEAVFLNYKRVVPKRKGARWFKDVGLGFKTPQEAINGTYIDKKCPFTGDVSIRGRILTGVVMSTKMERTIIVRRDYLHYVKKYNRYEKRHKNLAAHCSPAFVGVQAGDVVTIGECRYSPLPILTSSPLSKTVRFNVLKVQRKRDGSGKQFDKF